MDARYMAALKAFLSGHPAESPVDPMAPDPLRQRGGDRLDLARRVRPPGAGGSGPSGTELLPLILAQLPLERRYRLSR